MGKFRWWALLVCFDMYFWLYFIDYAIIVVPNFLPLLPFQNLPLLLKQSPHHCSCPWAMRVSSLGTPFPILCFTSPWLFRNFLSVLLNPLTWLFWMFRTLVPRDLGLTVAPKMMVSLTSLPGVLPIWRGQNVRGLGFLLVSPSLMFQSLGCFFFIAH